MSKLTLVPAYGRDYTSQDQVIADWNAGKDFLAQNYQQGGYINKEGAIEYGVAQVTIRYAKLRKLVVVEVAK
jgi:hypothetical protein